MNQLITIPQNAVFQKDGHAVTTSLIIGKVFGRRHDDVLKAIRNLNCSEEFGRRNFAESNYLNKQGKSQPMYEITRDGLSMLAFGFTGPEATKYKEDFINAFNLLAQQQQQAMLAALPSPDDLLRKGAQIYMALQKRLAASGNDMKWLKKLKKYRSMGLNKHEAGKLMGISRETVRSLEKQARETGVWEAL